MSDGVFLGDGRFAVAGTVGEDGPAPWAAVLETVGEARWQVSTHRAADTAPRLAVLPSGRVVVTTPGEVLALEPDGETAWRRPAFGKADVGSPTPDTFGDVVATPDGDTVLAGVRIDQIRVHEDLEDTLPVVSAYVLRLAGDGAERFMLELSDLGALPSALGVGEADLTHVAGTSLEDPAALVLATIGPTGGTGRARRIVFDEGVTVHDVLVLADGGTAFALSLRPAEGEPGDAAVLRLDDTAELAWYRRWDAPGDETAWRLAERDDGGLAVAATTTASATGGPEDPDLWVIELHADGETERQTLVSTPDPEVPVAVRVDDGAVEILGQRGEDVERWVLEGGVLAQGCGATSGPSFPVRPSTPTVEAIEVDARDLPHDEPPLEGGDLERPPPLPVPVCRE